MVTQIRRGLVLIYNTALDSVEHETPLLEEVIQPGPVSRFLSYDNGGGYAGATINNNTWTVPDTRYPGMYYCCTSVTTTFVPSAYPDLGRVEEARQDLQRPSGTHT